MANLTAKYSLLKRKYNQKEEENLSLREQIREYECNRSNSSGVNQAAITRLEIDRDAAKSDCVRLREETNALRDEMQRLKESHRRELVQLDQAKKDYSSCVEQFEVERRGLLTNIKQLTEEVQQYKERARELQTELSDHRTRSNQLKMVNEQRERELRTTQDLLQQTETELASALDRIQELNDEIQRLEWELKEVQQDKTSLKGNLTRLDQEKDLLLLKLDEKTEQYVRLEGELESRDQRISTLEGFIADLQKKLDLSLETAARCEQTSRQHTKETERLRKELEKMEKCRDVAVKENSRLLNDLAAMTHDHQQNTRSLETARREVEDLKLQLQGYVAEARRVTQKLEEKETERMAMLEHYRTLTEESANLESNNHSLESEARSTKSCLREAQTRIQDLEAKLQEKKALVHGYEKQIKELTQQVAKLESKLNCHSRSENATRELSRELEAQKHCLSHKVEQLSCDKNQLEEEVCNMRSQLSDMREQLSKERKNSHTLENVLVTSRQETLQRLKDNSDLKAQVQCLQTKLKELQDKLEHGSEALQRCKSDCENYQEQVTKLGRDLTNERFERARVEEIRRSRPVQRHLKRTAPRSRSLNSFQTMSSAYICPCCFLNKISLLRNIPEFCKQPNIDNLDCQQTQNKYTNNTESKSSTRYSDQNTGNVISSVLQEEIRNLNNANRFSSEISSTVTNSSVMVFKVDSGESEEFMLPERLVSESKRTKFSNASMTVEDSTLPTVGKGDVSDTTVNSSSEVELLAEQIDFVLQEQRQFLEELNLPIEEEEGFNLEINHVVELHPTGDSVKQNIAEREYSNSKTNLSKMFKLNKPVSGRPLFFASGDQGEVQRIEDERTSDKPVQSEVEPTGIYKKPVVHFNDEPVKLCKNFEWACPDETENNLNKDYHIDKNISVKMLFFPENELQCSKSSIESYESESTSVAASSVYVTAANSYTEMATPYVTNTVSSTCVQITCESSSGEHVQRD